MELKNSVKKYKSRYGVTFSCQYHVVWCPKYRRKVLTGDIGERLKLLIMQREGLGYDVLSMDIQSDYVHLLLDIDPLVGIIDVVKRIKNHTAHVLRAEFPELRSRLPNLWTRSLFISTVGSVDMVDIQRYIDEQKGV